VDWLDGDHRSTSGLGSKESTRPVLQFLRRCANAIFFTQTLSGSNPSKVDSLTLTLKRPDDLHEDDIPSLSDLRLFSSGGGSELTEWDMVHGTIRVRDNHVFACASNSSLSRGHYLRRAVPFGQSPQTLLRRSLHWVARMVPYTFCP